MKRAQGPGWSGHSPYRPTAGRKCPLMLYSLPLEVAMLLDMINFSDQAETEEPTKVWA
jgi:hypothetical protein